MTDPALLVRCGTEALVRETDTLLWAGAADTAVGAVALCRDNRPDVMLIGVRLDSDWRLCGMLASTFRGLALVALIDPRVSSRADVGLAARHGVSGLVVINTTIEHLVSAARITAERGHYTDPVLSDPPPEPPEPSAHHVGRPLSVRELQVLRLIADGRTAASIGHELGITVDTVRTHTSHLLAKLQARDRAHAVFRGFELSLLTCPRTTPPDRLPPL